MLLIGKDSERLINVAITRTRGKFIHVSNQDFIEHHVYRSKTLRQLVHHQVKQQQKITTKDIGTWIQSPHPQLQWIHARKLAQVFNDIDSAKHSVVLSLPEESTLSSEWVQHLANRQKHLKLAVVSTKHWLELKANEWVEEHFPFPFVLIDERILWLGLPLEGAKRTKPPYVAARLYSQGICEFILGQIYHQRK
jgi:hypothetical protein